MAYPRQSSAVEPRERGSFSMCSLQNCY